MSDAIKTRTESLNDLRSRVAKASKDRRMTDRSMMSVEMGDVKNALSAVVALGEELHKAQASADMSIGKEQFVLQDKFGSETGAADMGNCFPACIATVLGLSLAEVPHFYRDFDNIDAANTAIANFLGARGYHMAYYPAEVVQGGMRDGWFYAGTLEERVVAIVTGQSPRFDCKHAVVGYLDPSAPNGWVLLHDPHPSQEGITTTEGFEIISKTVRTKVTV